MPSRSLRGVLLWPRGWHPVLNLARRGRRSVCLYAETPLSRCTSTLQRLIRTDLRLVLQSDHSGAILSIFWQLALNQPAQQRVTKTQSKRLTFGHLIVEVCRDLDSLVNAESVDAVTPSAVQTSWGAHRVGTTGQFHRLAISRHLWEAMREILLFPCCCQSEPAQS